MATAASVGVLHTLLGPDHYLPFVALARAGGWDRRRTLAITILCGVGHVGGSVILGAVGIGLGLSLAHLEALEASRGSIAAWGLILFGLLYASWGIRRAARRASHTHPHAHADGSAHTHPHQHAGRHLHPHTAPEKGPMTPWVLFVVFVFGPCEALIPLLMFPAATQSTAALALVTATFGVATVGTMVVAVWAGLEGLRRLPFAGLERWAHALAGATIVCCGAAIQFLGL
jgi:sulfite exporter TauE/SafE